jgi:hypothetical protein
MICISIGVCIVIILVIGIIGGGLYQLVESKIVLGVMSLAQLGVLGYWAAGFVGTCEKTKYLYQDQK